MENIRHNIAMMLFLNRMTEMGTVKVMERVKILYLLVAKILKLGAACTSPP